MNDTRGRRAEWQSLFAVLVLTLAAAIWLADCVQRNATYSFDSNEGVHAFNARLFSLALYAVDVLLLYALGR